MVLFLLIVVVLTVAAVVLPHLESGAACSTRTLRIEGREGSARRIVLKFGPGNLIHGAVVAATLGDFPEHEDAEDQRGDTLHIDPFSQVSECSHLRAPKDRLTPTIPPMIPHVLPDKLPFLESF